MALRIAVGIVAALRAVLVYGEAGRLSTHPIRVPRLRRPAPASPAPRGRAVVATWSAGAPSARRAGG